MVGALAAREGDAHARPLGRLVGDPGDGALEADGFAVAGQQAHPDRRADRLEQVTLDEQPALPDVGGDALHLGSTVEVEQVAAEADRHLQGVARAGTSIGVLH